MPFPSPQNSPPQSTIAATAGSVFRTTCWSAVCQAREGDGNVALAGMERLARTYWRPLHSYALRQGLKEADAQDATQGFFQRFATGNSLRSVDASKGRFRSFLLVCFKNYLADEREKAQTQKRGGGIEFIPLDTADPGHNDRNAATALSGDEQYDLDWARSLMAEMVNRLEQEHLRAGKKDRYEALLPFLIEEPSPADLERIRKSLSLGESGLRSALQRLRFRFGEYLWTEIAKTVSHVSEVELETRYLLSILSKTDWLQETRS